VNELSKWIVVVGALGFAVMGAWIAATPQRVNEVLGDFKVAPKSITPIGMCVRSGLSVEPLP
jgi:hypothetical protein